MLACLYVLQSETATKILKIDTLQSYVNKTNGKEMTYFNVVAAEGHRWIRLRVYQCTKFQMVREQMSYKFANIIKKGEDEYWVTSRSFIAYSSVVETTVRPEDAPQLPEKMPPEGEQKTLMRALTSPEKSTISGKVVAVSLLVNFVHPQMCLPYSTRSC